MGNDRLTVWRDVVCAMIGLGILAVTLLMLYHTYTFVSHPFSPDQDQAMQAAYQRQKELVQFSLGLLGTVTGYYLGRIPGEQSARKAGKEAETAKQKRDGLAAAAKKVLAAQDLRAKGQGTSTLSLSHSAQTQGVDPELDIAIDELRSELMN